MIHEMHLENGPFKKIQNGTKNIELRLNDEKRKRINIDDVIKFCNKNNDEIVLARVSNLHKYKDFYELYNHFNETSLGYNEGEIKQPKDMEKYYSKEEIQKYGVLGIEVCLLNNKDSLFDLGTKTIFTERLILRKINEYDYKQAFKNWCSDKEVAKYVMWNHHENEETTKELYNNWISEYDKPFTFRWVVELNDTHELIGMIDVVKFKKEDKRAEIGYCYGSRYWNKGYATEALKAVIDYLLNIINVELVVSGFEVSNIASGKVMEKAGMKCVGYLPKWIINKEGKREDLKYCIIEKNTSI